MFAWAVKTTDMFPVPDAGDTDTQDAFDDTDHDVFDVNGSDALVSAADGCHSVPDNVSVGAGAVCPD